MATIRKRGTAQWEARIRKKGWAVTCKTFDTKIQAEQWSRQIESGVAPAKPDTLRLLTSG